MSHVLYDFKFVVIMSNVGYGDENHRIMVSEADIKPFDERTTPCRRIKARALSLGIGCGIC